MSAIKTTRSKSDYRPSKSEMKIIRGIDKAIERMKTIRDNIYAGQRRG